MYLNLGSFCYNTQSVKGMLGKSWQNWQDVVKCLDATSDITYTTAMDSLQLYHPFHCYHYYFHYHGNFILARTKAQSASSDLKKL